MMTENLTIEGGQKDVSSLEGTTVKKLSQSMLKIANNFKVYKSQSLV